MPEVQQSNLGTIQISEHAVATLVAETVLECYGVVGLSGKTKFDDWRKGLLNGPDAARGANVVIANGALTVDVYIIVEYGTRISEVARGVLHRVHYVLTQTVGLPITAVNVHVQGLRISSPM